MRLMIRQQLLIFRFLKATTKALAIFTIFVAFHLYIFEESTIRVLGNLLMATILFYLSNLPFTKVFYRKRQVTNKKVYEE